MGKQSSRIYYKGKDHKDIYYNQHYHSAMYICEESEDGKVECKLVWRKIFDENLYFHASIGKNINSSVHFLPSITVNIDTKKAYLTTNYTFRNEKQGAILYKPDWAYGKNCATLNAYGKKVYIDKELVFNEMYEFPLGFSAIGAKLTRSEYPAIVTQNSSNNMIIQKFLIKDGVEGENGDLTLESITINLNKYTDNISAGIYSLYNNSKYIYALARSSTYSVLVQSDLNGNIKTLKLENFDCWTEDYRTKTPSIIAVNGEKVYILATKVLEDENFEGKFVINSITIIDNMEIVSTEVIDSWMDNKSPITKGRLLARVYMQTVSPMTFIYSRSETVNEYARSYLITIDENDINVVDINIDNFSFFVNVYEDGNIVDTITVSSEFDCTDLKNGIVWLYELSVYRVANVIQAVDYKTEGFPSTMRYSADGWVESGTHGVFYDEETQYFYTFYIEKLYPSSSNFFIRFRA